MIKIKIWKIYKYMRDMEEIWKIYEKYKETSKTNWNYNHRKAQLTIFKLILLLIYLFFLPLLH